MIINIGLIGLGTIGSGLVKLLQKNSDLIEKRTGIKINLKKVCDINLKNSESLEIPKENLTTDYKDILNDKEINIIVELIGGYEPARKIILESLKKKKHVVTANKALLARYSNELFEEAQKNNVSIAFEGAVAGCIPIIKTIQESYTAQQINAIYGILNGTTNYILTKMQENLSYKDALKQAQKLGFAEQHPNFDVEGEDAAQKLTILASLIFNINIKDNIFTEGITKITKNDLKYAAELGYVIKLLAIAKKDNNEIELRVHPTMISKQHELASVNNELNAIYLIGENTGKVMLYGKGAGQSPTATVVLGNIIDIAKNNLTEVKFFNKSKIKKMDLVKSRYYLRYSVIDKPAVLAKISTVLGKNNISIAGVWQKEENKEIVPIIMITHEAVEKDLINAIKEINKLDVVKDETIVIRIEDIK